MSKKEVDQKYRLINKLNDFRIYIYKLTIRPVIKYYRLRKFQRNEKLINEAAGQIIFVLEPLLLRILSETLEDYNNNMQQSHASIQAQHDIKKFFELKIKSFIYTKK